MALFMKNEIFEYENVYLKIITQLSCYLELLFPKFTKYNIKKTRVKN